MTMAAFKQAMVDIYDADAAVQAITGRSELNLMVRGAQKYEVNLPVMTYYVVVATQVLGTKGRRNVIVRCEAWAKDADDDCITQLETLMDRAEALFVGAQFATHSVDVSRVRSVPRQDGAEVEDGVRNLRGDFTFVVTTV